VVVARERDQGGMALHSTTLRYGVIPAVLGELTRRRHDCVLAHHSFIRADREVGKARLVFAVRTVPGLSPASQTASGDRPSRQRRAVHRPVLALSSCRPGHSGALLVAEEPKGDAQEPARLA
jgi:hypothetical protein